MIVYFTIGSYDHFRRKSTIKYNNFMYLVEREFPKILTFFRVGDLFLLFDGFEPITPDKTLYYWHDPTTGDLYAMELADYIQEFPGREPDMDITEDYWPEHSCDWPVKRWLSHFDSTDYSDFKNWFYWPECGDKCAMAQLDANVSALKGRNLKREMINISPEQMAARRAKLEELITIDNQRG